MSHVDFYKYDYNFFSCGTYVCLLIFQNISHFENSQNISYRNDSKRTYSKSILGLFSNPNFHKSYFQNYRKTEFKICNKSTYRSLLHLLHISHSKTSQKKVITKIAGWTIQHISKHLGTLTSSYHIYEIIVTYEDLTLILSKFHSLKDPIRKVIEKHCRYQPTWNTNPIIY